MDEDPALQKSELQNKNAIPLEKGFSSPSDAITATSTIVSSVDNENPTLSSTLVTDEYESGLLAAITKHWEDILQIFWAGNGSGKSTIPPNYAPQSPGCEYDFYDSGKLSHSLCRWNETLFKKVEGTRK
jgi:hypothetical protein